MPTHATRYEGQIFSENGRLYHFKIYDKDYSGPTYSLTVGGGGIKIKYGASGQEKFSPIIASKCTISLMVEASNTGNHFTNFIKSLRNDYEEGDATLVIWNTVGTDAPPLWSGNILIDLSAKEDVSRPYEIELSATDGIGLLKNYDMVATQGSSPYEVADTYVSDGYQTFIYWIKTILEYCNTPDSDSTDGDVADYTFSTSVDWWYKDHPSPTTSISPLAYTQCQMLGSYEVNTDGLYKVKNVYQVLESFCKMWGMRFVFWNNRFYFTQLELYNTAETGTFAVPDNIDSQIWTRAGALSSGRAYLGEPDYTAYSQDLETNTGGFTGGLQKLAGSKWDYYPKLKQVSVEFASVSNNNYFQTFPQPTTSTTSYIDLITSSPITTITGASGLGGFNISIVLEFNNSWPTNEYCDIYWGVRAKPAGDPNFVNGYYISNIGNNPVSWSAWPSLSTTAFYSQGSGFGTFTCWIFMLDLLTLNSNGQGGAWSGVPIPPGISQQIFACVIPTDSHFTGDWDFEFFTYGCKMPYGGGGSGTPTSYIGNMSTNDIATGPTTQIPYITYSDVYNATGNPLSQFNTIVNTVIGGTLTQTSVYSARSETQKQEVKDIWWGDTPTAAEPNSLIYDDGAGSTGYTDPNGTWRNGQTGSYDKTLSELLCEARLFNQQVSDYKWSLSTVVSETKDVASDGTTTRPVYINPIGRIHDTVENIFYYILRGTFDITTDGWSGEWLQISLDGSISTTTTTTGTGGSVPSASSSAKLAPRNIGSLTAHLERGNLLTTLSANLAAGTITSLSINPFNDESGVPSQSDIIKDGDIFILRDGIKFYEFTASGDVGDTDTTISVDSTDTIVPISKGAAILTNNRDLYKQYQHQTRGTVAGFTVDSDGLTKGGVEITGWLDSDTMEGASDTSLPTSESVKAYVDSQVATSDTLQEVTDNGNTTTNDIMIGSSSTPTSKLHVQSADEVVATIERNDGSGYTVLNIKDGVGTTGNSVIRFSDTLASKGAINYEHANDSLSISTYGAEAMRITSDGNLLIGTTTDSGAKLKITTSESATTSTSLYLENTGSGGHEGVSIVFNPMYGATSMIASNREGYGSDTTNLSFHTCVVNDDPPIERMRITSDGNVGIGTTDPKKLLHVYASDDARIAITANHASGDASLDLLNTVDDKGWRTVHRNSNNLEIQYASSLSSGSIGSATAALTIDTSLNVGIGTTAPARELEVTGTGNVYIRVTPPSASDSAAIELNNTNELWTLKADDTSSDSFKITNDAGTALTIDTSKNVGIGTTAPGVKFHVIDGAGTTPGETVVGGTTAIFQNNDDAGDYASVDIIAGSTGVSSLYFGDDSDENAGHIIYNHSTDSMAFRTGGSGEDMRITSAGNVGIGTTGPAYKLDVRNSSTLFYGQTDLTDTTSIFRIRANGGSSEVLEIEANGNIGIATTSPASLLHVAGTVQVGVDDTGHDVKFFGATSGKYMLWDESADTLVVNGNIDVQGNSATIGSSSQTTTTLNLTATNTDGAPANAVEVIMTGYEGRGIGHFYKDTSYSGKEWFSGLIYSGAFANWAIGYDASGGQPEYAANSLLIIYKNGDATFAGDVKLASTTPTLEVEGVNGASIIIDSDSDNSGTAGSYLRFYDNGSHIWSWYKETNNDMYLYNAGQTKYPIHFANEGDAWLMEDGGDLGIGNTGNPAAKLHVAGTVQVGVNNTGHDVKFFGDTDGKYMLWDESQDALTFPDSTYLYLGAGNDLQLYHNGTDSHIANYAGDLYITQHTNDKDLIFRCDDGFDSFETYFYLDGSDATANPMTVFPDNSFLCFGSNTITQTGDLQIKHNGVNSFINNYTGDLQIKNEADDKDIIFKADAGGTVSEIMRIDGSSGNVGIGTTSPAANLHVLSSGNGEIEVERTSGALINLQAQATKGVIGTESNHQLHFKTNANVWATIKTSGEVGIGTTTPISTLDVNGTISLSGETENKLYKASTSPVNGTVTNTTVLYGRQIDLYALDDLVLRTGTSGSDDIIFFAGNSEKGRIKGSGNFGIGTSSPASPLEIRREDSGDLLTFDRIGVDTGTIKVTSTYFAINTAAGLTTLFNDGQLDVDFKVQTDNTGKVFFVEGSSGNIGIGTDSPASELHVNGAATLTAMAEPSDPAVSDCIIWLDSTTLDLMVKITGESSTVTRTIASFAE